VEIAMAETITSSSTEQNTTSSGGRPAGQLIADLEQQRRQCDQRTRPEVEAHRRQAQQEAENTLDTEAIAAVQQTERALNAIAEGRMEEALAAIEQATGKVNVLLSRNPATALIPVSVQVNVIDTAPDNLADVVVLRDATQVAVDINDLPEARTLLDSLRSEIRVRVYHVPLATYPAALQEAARLLDQKRTDEAATVLLVALNTLAIIDQVTSLPTLLARQAVNAAQALAQKDKDAAQRLLEFAQHELERGMELGYARGDEDYLASLEDIKKLRKQLKANEDTTSPFSRLKEKLAALMHRQPEKRIQPAEQEQPRKAA
jgi:hypothetical protein